MKTRSCKGCGVEIVWAKDPTGQPIPLETRTVAYLVELDEKRGYTCKRIRPSESDRGHTAVAMANHLNSCPMAHAFRSGAVDFTPPPEEKAPPGPEQQDLLAAFASGESDTNQEEDER